MKTYFADTNIFVRLFLRDDLRQYRLARKAVSRAQKRQIRLVVIPEVIFEVEYILRKRYLLDRKFVVRHLASLVKTPYVTVEDRNIWVEVVDVYSRTKFDLVDIYLAEKARSVGAEVLSFDKDFRKLRK